MKGARLNPFQHALVRPDTYVGSVETCVQETWVYKNILDEINEDESTKDNSSNEDVEDDVDDAEELDDKKVENKKEQPNQAVLKLINYNPGLFNITREVVSNSIDNVWRSTKLCPDTPVKKICISVNSEKGSIEVWNDGYCIPVRKDEYDFTDPRTGEVKVENLYPAEVYFGDMFAGTNLNDDVERKTSGRNGMGAKITIVFSEEFTITHAHPEDQKIFTQTYRKNGTQRTQPEITKYNKKSGFTQVSFTPDYKYFNYPNAEYPGMDKDFISLLKLYAHEVAMITGVMVVFKVDEEVTTIKIPTLEKFVRLFYPNTTENKLISLKSSFGDECVVVELDFPTFDEADATYNISFVNGICTKDGGIHVDVWENYIVSNIVKAFNARKTKKPNETSVKTTARAVNPYFALFLRTEVDRPKFDSQTKNKLIKIYDESKSEISYRLFDSNKKKVWKNEFNVALAKMMKWNFVVLLEEKLKFKQDVLQAKKEGIIRKKVVLGDKAIDANYAVSGLGELKKRIGMVTEGDSALNFAIRGRSAIPNGHDYYGAFPIRGKFINAISNAIKKVKANKEVEGLMRFFGLRFGARYDRDEDYNTLRYGTMCIFTDADDDGIHIRGLLILFIIKFWPELFKRGFVTSLSTAVSIVNIPKLEPLLFFSNSEFKKWHDANNRIQNVNVKYYKGLATIEKKQAPVYFKNQKLVTYSTNEDTPNAINLGFGSDSSNSRKGLIKDYINKLTLDKDYVYDGNLNVNSFIYDQLIIYQKMALRRAIPCKWDGLKEGQRKIVYTIFEKDYKKLNDLEKITGAVKELTAYHHGGNSISDTVAKMGQDYVGTNNVLLFDPSGEYGSRMPNKTNGGAGAGRYIEARNGGMGRYLYPKIDDILLVKNVESGELVEYIHYMPIYPSVLSNGCKGIACGYSTEIPNYNPLDVIKKVKVWIERGNDGVDKTPRLCPWYLGYKGEIKLLYEEGSDVPTQWISKGILEEATSKTEKGWWHIRELPIGMQILEFQMWLDYLETGTMPIGRNKKEKKLPKLTTKYISEVKSYNDANRVHFMIKPTKNFKPDINTKNNFKNLQKTFSLKNMVLINENDLPQKYASAEDIIKDFCPKRLEYYEKRKNYLSDTKKVKLMKARAKFSFIEAVKDKKLNLYLEEDVLDKVLSEEPWSFPKFASQKINDDKDKCDSENKDSENKETKNKNNTPSYDYLLRLQIRTMTVKKLEGLKNEAEKLESELQKINMTSPTDMWIQDLDLFEVEYKKFLKKFEKENAGI